MLEQVLLYGALFVVISIFVIWLINSRYVKTWFQVAHANLGEASRNLEANNALKLMKQGIEECTIQVRKARTGLVKVQGSISSLQRQVSAGAAEEARLVNRIQQAMDAGKTDTDPMLLQMASNLKRVREDLATNKEQLETHHSVYNDLLGQIQAAQRRAEKLESEATQLGSKLETSKLTAELSEFATNFDTGGLTTAFQGAAKYKELVIRQIEENNAKLKVNKDLGNNVQDTEQWEDTQDAQNILSELRAKK